MISITFLLVRDLRSLGEPYTFIAANILLKSLCRVERNTTNMFSFLDFLSSLGEPINDSERQKVEERRG